MSFDVGRFEQAVAQQLASAAEQQATSALQQGVTDALGGETGQALGSAAGQLAGVGADQARAAAEGRAGEGLEQQLAGVASSQAGAGAGALGEQLGGEEGRQAATQGASAASQALEQALAADAPAAPATQSTAAPVPMTPAPVTPASSSPSAPPLTPASAATAPASGTATPAPGASPPVVGPAAPVASPGQSLAHGGAGHRSAHAGGGGAAAVPAAATDPALPASRRPHVPVLDPTAGTQAPGALHEQASDRWASALDDAWTGLTKPLDPARSGPQHAADVLRRTQSLVAAAWDTFNLPGDMLNAAAAQLLQPLANMLAPMPAITLGKMWMSIPHVHTHPPTFTPPAPPVPLPAVGAVLLGTCVRVLINSMPAARVKDIGIAPTCTGFTPFFQIKMGSSSVFIGGTRAARIIDLGLVCGSADERETDSKFLQKLAAAADKIDGVVSKIGMGVAIMGIAADAAEAATEDDAAMSAAKAMAAGMGAAQMIADQIAAAMTKSMGKDPAMTPPIVPGMFLEGSPTVQIGGFPMIHIPNPAELLLNKLKAYKPRRPRVSSEDDAQPQRKQGNTACPP